VAWDSENRLRRSIVARLEEAEKRGQRVIAKARKFTFEISSPLGPLSSGKTMLVRHTLSHVPRPNTKSRHSAQRANRGAAKPTRAWNVKILPQNYFTTLRDFKTTRWTSSSFVTKLPTNSSSQPAQRFVIQTRYINHASIVMAMLIPPFIH